MKNKLLLAAITITLLFTIVACGHIDTQPAYFAEIKAQALAELGLASDTPCELRLEEETPCAWQDGVCEEYTLVVGETEYAVGVRRDGAEITFVDVEVER